MSVWSVSEGLCQEDVHVKPQARTRGQFTSICKPPDKQTSYLRYYFRIYYNVKTIWSFNKLNVSENNYLITKAF